MKVIVHTEVGPMGRALVISASNRLGIPIGAVTRVADQDERIVIVLDEAEWPNRDALAGLFGGMTHTRVVFERENAIPATG